MGSSARAGPIWREASHLILTQLAPIIVGKDPLAIELLWDQMHRLQVHGRQGYGMVAISAIDCALWDLKGKALAQPIWRLLGGPTRHEVPAYASMLGYSVEDSARCAKGRGPIRRGATPRRNGSSATGRRPAARA